MSKASLLISSDLFDLYIYANDVKKNEYFTVKMCTRCWFFSIKFFVRITYREFMSVSDRLYFSEVKNTDRLIQTKPLYIRVHMQPVGYS